MGIEDTRTKIGIRKIRNSGMPISNDFLKDGVKSIAQGVERDIKTPVSSFFEKGKVKTLQASYGKNWVSEGKVAEVSTRVGAVRE